MTRPPWPEERTQELRILRDAGWKTVDLMARYGVTRSALLGKLHRMGMLGHANERVPRLHACRVCQRSLPPERTLAYCNACYAEVRKRWRPSEAPYRPRNKADCVFPHRVDIAFQAVTIFDLQRAHCRWPVEDDKYCGNEVQFGPYCPAHRKVAYR